MIQAVNKTFWFFCDQRCTNNSCQLYPSKCSQQQSRCLCCL